MRLWVRIPLGAWTFVCCECCVLSGRGLCHELITPPEESYRLWRVVVWDLETSKEEAKSPLKGCEYKPTMDCDAERERKKITKMDDNETSSFGNRSLQSCSRPVIPRIGCCKWTVYISFICVRDWSPFFPICFDGTQVRDSEWPDILSFHDKLSVIRSLLPPTI